MTLALAWTHAAGKTQELVCATDSRLTFDGHWDCGPKLFPTCRGDSVIMFAGDTIYAYPIIHHVLAAISQHPKSARRAFDLPELKGHLLRVLNATLKEVADLPKAVATPEVEFIFAGYDWRQKKYTGWRLLHDKAIKRFTFQPMGGWSHGKATKRLMLAGDYQDEFKRRLVLLLRERGKLTTGEFDIEPFEVLRDMLRSGDFPHIGGPPQMAKIYQHLNTTPVAVCWPSFADGRVSIGGRALLEYEKIEMPTLAPDLLTVQRRGGGT
jgi:hypothetical protein